MGLDEDARCDEQYEGSKYYLQDRIDNPDPEADVTKFSNLLLALKDIKDILRCMDDELLEEMFGDHASVIVERYRSLPRRNG